MLRSARALALVVATVATGTTVAGSVAAATPVTVLAYGASDYRFLEVQSGGGSPGFAEVGFDDGAFGVGTAPFGDPGDASCGLVAATPWSPGTDLLLRRTVTVPEHATDMRINVAIDNDVTLYWNGAPIGATVHEGCASPGSFSVGVPDALLTPGDNLLAARATDRGGASHVDLEVVAELTENQPPDCSSVRLEPATLWPPDHTFTTVTARGGSDPEGDPVSLTISGVTQDEPLDGVGDGHTTPDAMPGASADAAQLRAERAGPRDGRVYRVTVSGTDTAGASCTTTAFVTVPHDRGRRGSAVDTVAVVVDSYGGV